MTSLRHILYFLLAVSATTFWGTGFAGDPASRIIVKNMDEAALDQLMHTKDKQSLIVVMASWCLPCRKELPTLVKLQDKFRTEGLEIIGISLDVDGPQAMQPIVDRLKVNFPVYCVGEEPAQTYNIRAVPVMFFVRNGQIVERLVGIQSRDHLEMKITRFLREG